MHHLVSRFVRRKLQRTLRRHRLQKARSAVTPRRAGWIGLQPLEPRMLLSAAADVDLYDRWLVVETNAGSEVLASVAVLETELQNMTDTDFTVTNTKTTGRGIFLLKAAADLATRYPELASQSSDLTTLATKDTEGFFIYLGGFGQPFYRGQHGQCLGPGRILLPPAAWLAAAIAW